MPPETREMHLERRSLASQLRYLADQLRTGDYNTTVSVALALDIMANDLDAEQAKQADPPACGHSIELQVGVPKCLACDLLALRDRLTEMTTPAYWRREARRHGTHWPF